MDTVYLIGIHAEGSAVRGSDMCSRLKETFPRHRIVVVGAAPDAMLFWEKMRERGLVDDWSEADVDEYFGLDDDEGESVALRKPLPPPSHPATDRIEEHLPGAGDP